MFNLWYGIQVSFPQLEGENDKESYFPEAV